MSPRRPAPSSPRAPRVACTLALLGLVAALPATATRDPTRQGTTATGRIEGDVTISTALSARRPRFRIYADPGPGARPPARETNEIRNVVLYVENAVVPAGGTPSPPSAMAQEHERFVPHVLPVLAGTTVEFPNADDVFHNVFSLSSARTFDLGRYPKGRAKSVTFDRSGTVQLFCHLHSDMSGVILVLDNPYFAVPSNAGRYAIENVPPGDYTVIGWHERIRPVVRTVRVRAGGTARLDFEIPLPSGGEPTTAP